MKVLIAAIASVLMITSVHAQDGARAYTLLPTGTNEISLTVDVLHSEVGGSTFDAGVLTPSYLRTIDIGGHAGAVIVGIPIGSLSASLATRIGNVPLNNAPAVGDLFLEGVLGLVGAPSLSPQEYVRYKAGLQAAIATKLYLPTGDYDSSRILNLGGNRWSLQVSLPVTYVWGSSLVDPNRTTFEIIPSVHFFGNNEDSFGPVTVTSELPVFGLEGHITHSFGRALWASVDAYSQVGGETSSDGVANADGQQSVFLGGTLGLVLSPAVAIRLSYEQQVYSNRAGTSAGHFEATTAFLF